MANDVQMWSPFRELDRFRRDFDDLFDRFLGGRLTREPRVLAPSVESFVDDGKLVVRADLPGIDPKDVEITVAGDQLTIRGKRERREEQKRGDFIHREVSYGSFERTIKLPEGVKPDDIKASYNNGVLELTAPLPKEAQTRKVPIQVEGPSGQSGGATQVESRQSEKK
jgi:HSP20 family protein